MTNHSNLDIVDSYKYVGVIFHEHLDYSIHCDAISKGAGRAIGGIISKLHKTRDIGFKSYEKLYFSCVTPILEYGASIWGFQSFKSLDNIQNRSIRFFLGVHRFVTIAALQGDTGWLPCVYRQWISIIRYWNRLILLDENRLTKTVFNSDYETCQNKNNWCSDIKNMLGTIGLSDYFYNRETIDSSPATRKTKEHFTSQWRNSIAQTPKLRTYKLFKNAHTTDQYVLLDLQKNERFMLAQLRCGILSLCIETSRYTGEPADSRLCTFCDSSEMENECHFVTSSSLYNTLRSNIFGEVLNTDPVIQL